MKIGILMGGNSSEREISLLSGKAVSFALRDAGYDIREIDVNNQDSIRERIRNEKIGTVFIALHGRFGEDGGIQGILESLKIPYTGSGVEASRLAMDKAVSMEFFERAGIEVPQYRIFRNAPADSPFPFPVVMKPAREGSSIGISIADDERTFCSAVECAFRYDDKIIVEEYIKGIEITVGILDDAALEVIQIAAKRRLYDYISKYEDVGTEYIIPAGIPVEIREQAKEAALKAHRILGCRFFSRVDMIYSDDGRIVVLEVNTIPGLTKKSLLPKAASAAGIDFQQLCIKILNSALPGRRGGRSKDVPFAGIDTENFDGNVLFDMEKISEGRS